MVKFKWKKEDGTLTQKAKTYLSLTYKNQFSEGIFNQNKEEVEEELVKQPSQKPKILKRKIKNKLAPIEVPKERIRRQLVANYKSKDDPYAISFRVITINPNVDKTQMERIMMILLNKYNKKRIKREDNGEYVDIYLKSFTGEENFEPPTELGKEEDKYLNDMRIHTEVLIANNKPIYNKF